MNLKPIVSFGVALLLLLSVIILDRVTFWRVEEHGAQVAHTQEVIGRLEQLSNHFKSAQIYSERLARKTGLSFYRLSLQEAAAIPHEVSELQTLMSDNPAQRASIDTLAAQLKEQIPTLLVYSIAELVERGDSQRLITLFAMHQRIRNCISVEQELLLKRQEKLQHFVRMNSILSWLFVILALSMLASAFFAGRSARRRQQQLESEVRAYVSQLEHSNSELEQFAYASSHDLQEPLRKIRVFASQLKGSTEGRLNDTEQGFLEKLMRSAERMTFLIHDLLAYSALRKRHVFEPTDLREVLQNCLEDLDLLIQQKDARVEASGLCTIDAIPLQMTQLFYNLLNNSLKFSRAGVPPHIQVHCRLTSDATMLEAEGLPAGEYCLIEFRDNGRGFSADQDEQIFALFRRASTVAEGGGSGIGLALCRKVVENHGGFIRAEGHEGEGAIFRVLLPVRQAAGEADA